MIVGTSLQRLHDKSYPRCLASRLGRDYDLSPVEACQPLSEEPIREHSQDSPSFLSDGQGTSWRIKSMTGLTVCAE